LKKCQHDHLCHFFCTTLYHAGALFVNILVAQKLGPSWVHRYGDTQSLNDFINYFMNQWINNDILNTWAECASIYPSTNNGLERFNKTIKDSHTIRGKEEFRLFLQTVEKMVSFWSASPDYQVK
jgi:hypothetical protein